MAREACRSLLGDLIRLKNDIVPKDYLLPQRCLP